jgi:hypothetical protein
MAASQLSTRYVLWHTSELTTVDLSTATMLGTLAGDAEVPEPESTMDPFQGGEAEVEARIPVNVRVIGAGGTPMTTLQTAKNANPPTSGWLYFPNRSLTNVRRIGPFTPARANQVGNSTNPMRKSWRLRGLVVGDAAEEIDKTVEGTIVLPS